MRSQMRRSPGYRVYFGTASRTYSTTNDAGNVTQTSVANLSAGLAYFFALTAYDQDGLESDYSAELAYTVPVTNTPPTITGIADKTINEDRFTAAISFTVGDAETAATSLMLSRSSSNTRLVPANNIVFGGSGTNRTVRVTPAANQSGSATITLSVSDGQLSASNSFVLTVNPVNDAPAISSVGNQVVQVNSTTGPLSFTVGDVETADGSLTLSRSSSNPGLVPTNNIVLGGSGANRTVTVTPATNQSGSATIMLSVSDGQLSASKSFVLTVRAAPTIALTAPADGTAYTAPATINLAASVVTNGHTISSVQFFNGTNLLGENATSPYSLAWTNVSADAYSLSARLVYDIGSILDSSTVSVTVTDPPPPPPPPALLAPWQTVDIGSVDASGSASQSNGVFAVAGAGNIGRTADNFRFVYQPLSGDGEISIQITSTESTGTPGRSGVMIRETLADNSRNAFMGISSADSFRWQRRLRTGGNTSPTPAGSGKLPAVWVRLVRSADLLTGYKSADGVSWTQVNSMTITMATNIYVGLAVSSGSTNTLNHSTFSNVSVVP